MKGTAWAEAPGEVQLGPSEGRQGPRGTGWKGGRKQVTETRELVIRVKFWWWLFLFSV